MTSRAARRAPLPTNSAPYTVILYARPGDGRRMRARPDAQEVKHAPFEDSVPIRNFPSYRGRVAQHGRYWFSRTRSHVRFESRFEMTALMTLDQRGDVKAVSSNPFWALWPKGSKPVRHAPDFFVRRQDGRVLIMDVKPEARFTDHDRIQHQRMRELCDEMGWCYEEFTTIDPVMERNLRFLSGFRHPRFALPDGISAVMTERLRATEPLGQSLAGAVAHAVGMGGDLPQGRLLSGVYHMLWTNQIHTDLCRTLSWNTRVTL